MAIEGLNVMPKNTFKAKFATDPSAFEKVLY